MRLSCVPTAGTIIFPHSLPSDSVRCIFSRHAWQGGPHWLNYPAVLVTPTPLFTCSGWSRVMGGNGVGPGCLFLDPNSSLFNLYSSGSRFQNIITRMLQARLYHLLRSNVLSLSPPDYCGTHNNIHLEVLFLTSLVWASLWLPDWFIFPLSIFHHNSPTHYNGEIQTSTLKNVCCWDTWLITGLPTQFYLCR